VKKGIDLFFYCLYIIFGSGPFRIKSLGRFPRGGFAAACVMMSGALVSPLL
jgi:hypothetical protein